MRYAPSRHVHIDWKVAGADWLTLLRDEFPEVAALQGDAFEAVLDELAHEEVESCLQTLANLLHGHGYEVWNLDVGADDFRVALVPASKRAVFERYWKKHKPEDFDDEEVEIELQRTEPENVEAAATKQRKPQGKRKKKPDWLAEKKIFNAFHADKLDVCDGRVLASRCRDMDGDTRVREWRFWQMDLRQWPPTFELIYKWKQDDPREGFPHLLGADPAFTLWQWGNAGEDSEPKPLHIRRDGQWEDFGPPDACYPAATNSEESHLWHDGEFWCVRYRDVNDERRWQVSRTSATSTETLYEAPEFPGHLHAMGAGRVLLMSEHGYRVWEAGTLGELRPLPVSTRAWRAVAWLGGDEILFFDHFQRDVIPPWWRDDILRMWRFDIVTGACRCVEMEGYGVQYNAMPLDIDGTVKKRKSMSARTRGLHIERGHGDWWVINYDDNVLGVRTIAWLWDASTDEVIKITSKDIPRWTPIIFYVAALDSYLGLADDGVIKLPEFETIRAANGGAYLSWEAPPVEVAMEQ